MKKLREIITNSIGIAIVVVHWIIVTFILFNDGVYQFKTYVSPFRGILVPHALGSRSSEFLVELNYIPVIIVKVLFAPIKQSFDKTIFLEFSFFFAFFICSTFQWLLVGYFISQFIFSNREVEKIKFSLKQ